MEEYIAMPLNKLPHFNIMIEHTDEIMKHLPVFDHPEIKDFSYWLSAQYPNDKIIQTFALMVELSERAFKILKKDNQ